jgi:hypothetical protein
MDVPPILSASSGEVVEYTWDERERLTKVVVRASAGGAIIEQSEYTYDEDNCILIRTIAGDAAGDDEMDSFFEAPEDLCRYVGCRDAGEPTQRYIYGSGIDELFAFDDAAGDS